jgi:YVTN family beta-propeller protein
MHKTFIFIILSLSYSCVKEVNPVIIDSEKTYLSGDGVFILNEGNFKSGNGSLSFFSYDSLKVYNHVFLNINQRPLGDIPYSMGFHANKAYILVNNSGKIEVTDRNYLKSVATINNIISPRYMSFISDSKGYVTSLYSDSIAIIDLLGNSVSGYINIKKTSESIVTLYTTSYVANWAGGNKVMVINAATDQVTDSISVGSEPESMVVDKNETLWVLCNGGWKRENYAELIGISTRTNKIERRFTFPSLSDSPSCLQIDGKGATLYFLLNGVRKMAIEAQSLPSLSIIPELDHTFYKLGINPANDDIFVTDVVDYVRKGKILRYSKGGALISEMETDIIPGTLCFKVKPDNTSE